MTRPTSHEPFVSIKKYSFFSVLRITGGTIRGRKLATPKNGVPIRPTSDRVREALFNILRDRVPGSNVLDLFAGTGALGIEALSRGADYAFFVDQSKIAAKLIHANLLTSFSKPAAGFLLLNLLNPEALKKMEDQFRPDIAFNLVFMDPPYNKNLATPLLKHIGQTKLLATDSLIIVEEHQHADLPDTVAQLQVIDRRIYGETGIWLYAPFPNRH